MNKRINHKSDKYVKEIPKMDAALYTLRRKVIDLLYQARELTPKGRAMPRVEVRIVQYQDEHINGTAFMGRNIIHISHDMVNWTSEALARVVWHELAHAWFAKEHVKGNILMNPSGGRQSKPSIEALKTEFRTIAAMAA